MFVPSVAPRATDRHAGLLVTVAVIAVVVVALASTAAVVIASAACVGHSLPPSRFSRVYSLRSLPPLLLPRLALLCP